MRPRSRKRGFAPLSQIINHTSKQHQQNRRRNKNITQQLFSMPASTSNAYESLNSDEDISELESMVSVTSKRAKLAASRKNLPVNEPKSSPTSSHKPPPINIEGVEYKTVIELIKSHNAGVDDFSLSLTQFGVRVYSANTDKYNVLKRALKLANFKFYTYQPRDEQMTKIVLHGFYCMDTNELKEHLKFKNVFPSDIKNMSIQNKRNSDHAVYLLYFPKSAKVKISDLRQITNICNVRIRWQYYSNRRTGPTQCNRCMMYGHGGRNCELDPKCIRCSGPHLSNQCPSLRDPITGEVRNRIPDNMLKCALCHQNHSANFSGCTKRQEFIDRQQNYRARNQRHTRRNAHSHGSFVNAPQLDNFNFPPLDPRARANRLPQPPLFRPIVPSNDLFSPSEMMTIFTELVTAISQCRNKMEQISALAEIVNKYIYNGQR